MTLQWTFVASVLYAEIFVVSLLLLPFLNPKTWQRVFRSTIFSWLAKYSKIYFYIFIAILCLLFAESCREVSKYSEPLDTEELRRYPEAEVAMHMKLFRAQRNMYIAGFALFLWFILRRLVILIANEAALMAESEASIKQAQSASAAALAMMDDKSSTADNKKNSDKDSSSAKKDLENTKVELEKTKEELYKAKADLETMKKQAESTNKEYDRLMGEHSKLQAQLASSDKKDD